MQQDIFCDPNQTAGVSNENRERIFPSACQSLLSIKSTLASTFISTTTSFLKSQRSRLTLTRRRHICLQPSSLHFIPFGGISFGSRLCSRSWSILVLLYVRSVSWQDSRGVKTRTNATSARLTRVRCLSSSDLFTPVTYAPPGFLQEAWIWEPKSTKMKKSVCLQLAGTAACGRTSVWRQAWDLLEPSEQNSSFTVITRLHFLLSPPPCPPHLLRVARFCSSIWCPTMILFILESYINQ